MPSTRNKKACSFGIGERFADQTLKLRKNNNPSPDAYNVPTVFKPDNTTSTFAIHCKGDKTFCFGSGREAFNKTVINKARLPQEQSSPGPSKYDQLIPFGTESKKFKLKGKIPYNDPAMIAIKRGVPGVGTYEDQLSLDRTGTYNANSQWNNSKAQKWAPAYDRFKVPNTTPQ